jgi:hypothetical protein
MQATEPMDILHVIFTIQHERWYLLATKRPGYFLGTFVFQTPDSCTIGIEVSIIKVSNLIIATMARPS